MPDREVPAGDPLFPPSSGKSHADRERARYLLEDEPEPASHGGKILVLLLFFAVMGVAVWHWHQNLHDLGARLVQPATQTNPQPTDTSSSSPAAVGATTSSSADANAGSPKLDAGTAQPTMPTQASAAPGNPPPTASPAQPPVPAPSAANPPSATPAPTLSQPPATPQDQSSTSPPTAQNNLTPRAETAATPPETSPPKAIRPPAKPAVTQAADAPAARRDSLETEGENYLYGNGVPQNCGRAQKKLLAAAGHGVAKAYSVLGTMFATGHCAPRDLPLAYRWFAKALHQDPANTRIEDDLKALWNQMTPDERRLALRNQ